MRGTMIAGAEFARLGLLAAAALLGLFSLTLAWSAPRKPGANVPVAGPSAATRTVAETGANFAGKLPITELNEQEAILHALNRLGYGPRPGEVEEIEKTGLENWVQAQLHPETTPESAPESTEDAALDARLSQYPAWNLSAAQLLDQYPQPQVAAKRLGITVEEYQKLLQDEAKQPQGTSFAPYKDQQEIVNDLMEIKLLRAVYSEHQLTEQLSDFWLNHFNVFIYKDLDRWYMIPYERDAIRPHVLGKFRDLLGATAKSPAIQFYLDNYLSADPGSFDRLKKHPVRARPGQKLPPLGGKRGLNENYGRELMELHTLGADGGYTQKDVIEVARSFTGWTIVGPRDNPEFYFDARLHDPGPKRVLGKTIHAGGIKHGEQVLDLLAKNPHTAHRISLLLARHFVSDNPPEALVQRMAKTFEKSKGNLRAVMTTMIYSPEFWSRDAYRAKVKTPFELVASATRALGTNVSQPLPIVQWIARIGEPLYQCQTPDGYSDVAAAWVSTGSLLNRMNFAITLAGNKIRGGEVNIHAVVGPDLAADPQMAMDRAMNRMIAQVLAGQISESSRAALVKETSDPKFLGAKLDDSARTINLEMIAGLVLGSPEFQKR